MPPKKGIKKLPPIALTLESKRTYIVENADLLDVTTQRLILNTVMQEFLPDKKATGYKSKFKRIFMTTDNEGETLNLTEIQKMNSKIIHQIYGIVNSHISQLSRPAGETSTAKTATTKTVKK
jgi:hypothetical protein